MLKRSLRNLFERALRGRGYALKRVGEPPRGFDACLAYARSRGLAPRTVLDVGVGHGTPWLYEAFPAAKLVLFEPLADFAEDLARIRQERGADVHMTALGSAPGSVLLNVNRFSPTGSTLHTIDPAYAAFSARRALRYEFEAREVTRATLDSLNTYDPPYLLKIDVEGAEADVLAGAHRTLQQTDYLLLEVSVMRRVVEGADFATTIRLLDELGFALFDVPALAQSSRAETAQLLYLDAAFVRKDSALWPS